MRTSTLCLGIVMSAAAFGCGGEESQQSGTASATHPASCEAMVDHQIAECPENARRLFDIERCEEDRRDAAPIGCSQPLADFVLCQTEGELDCESGYTQGCDDELSRLQRCRQLFAIDTSCSRAGSRDARDCGDTGRFSFLCIDLSTLSAPEVPDHCEAVEERIFCCDSFSGDTLDETLFIDPVLGTDELPPDYSGVDFANAAMCLDFSEGQGWGRCEASSGCACTHCATELATCAADHGC